MIGKSDKKLLVILLSAIAGSIAFLSIVFLATSNKKELKLDGYDRGIIIRIGLAESKSELKGYSFILKDNIDDLEKIIKRYDKKADWFNRNDKTFYIKNTESQKEKLMSISDGEHCAKIELKDEYTITGYSFSREKCSGNKVNSRTKEEIEKLPEILKD